MTLVKTGICESGADASVSPAVTEHYRGEVDISGNEFPEVGGTNDMKYGGGRPTRGDYYMTTAVGNLLDRSENVIEVPTGSMLYYLGDVDGDMQLGANWKINQG